MDPPEPHDVTDFRFKALRKVRLTSPCSSPGPPLDQVAVVPTAGLVVVGGGQVLHVLKTGDVEQQDRGASKVERGQENAAFLGDKVCSVELPGPLVSLGVSCDGLVVSGVVLGQTFPTCYLWDTRGLTNSPPEKPFASISLDTTVAGASVTGVAWNPAFHHTFCVTFSDGSLAMYTVKDDGGTDCVTLPPAEGVVAVSWSPKGKQMVGVKKDGSLTQYKPDLKEARSWAGPSSPPGLIPVSCTWLSTYEFIVGYRDPSDPDKPPGVWLVKGSKAGSVEYVFYDDVCYSTGPAGTCVFGMLSMAEWGVLLVASTASLELGVLGSREGAYSQWILEDNARAELPLDSNNEERYPVGLAMDFTAAGPEPQEKGEGLGPPAPLIYLLSSDGVLCPYYCLNQAESAPPAPCKPPVPLPQEGRRQGKVNFPITTTDAKQAPAPKPGPSANISDIFNLSSNSSFAQSTPVKPLPTGSLFQQPAVVKTVPIDVAKVVPAAVAKAVPAAVAKVIPAAVSKVVPAAVISTSATRVTDPAAALTITPVVSTHKPKAATPPVSNNPTKSPFPSSLSKKKETPSSKEVSPSMDNTSIKLLAAIDEEYKAFGCELQELRESITSGLANLNIGSQEDKVTLVTRTKMQAEFCDDVVETTKCQNSEIQDLRSDTLESFGWLEDARSRDSSQGDTRYVQLLRARPLDPRAQRKLGDLRDQFLYCEQQVEEVGNSLDLQWEEHVTRLQRNVRGPGGGRQTEGERLSQALLTNHAVLESQQVLISDLQERTATLRASCPLTLGKVGGREESRAETELDKLAESLREKSRISVGGKVSSPVKTMLQEITVNTPGKVRTPSPALIKDKVKVLSPVKSLPVEKEGRLRDLLDHREIIVSRSVKPQPAPVRQDSAKLVKKLNNGVLPQHKTETKVSAPRAMNFGPTPAIVTPCGQPKETSAFKSFVSSSPGSIAPTSTPSVFKSGGITVELSAVKTPTYEPISPADNSPEKDEKTTEEITKKKEDVKESLNFGSLKKIDQTTGTALLTQKPVGAFFGGIISKTPTESTLFGGITTKTAAQSTAIGGLKPTTENTVFGGITAKPTTESTTFGGMTSKPTTDSTAFGEFTSKPTTESTTFGSMTSKATTESTAFGGLAKSISMATPFSLPLPDTSLKQSSSLFAVSSTSSSLSSKSDSIASKSRSSTPPESKAPTPIPETAKSSSPAVDLPAKSELEKSGVTTATSIFGSVSSASIFGGLKPGSSSSFGVSTTKSGGDTSFSFGGSSTAASESKSSSAIVSTPFLETSSVGKDVKSNPVSTMATSGSAESSTEKSEKSKVAEENNSTVSDTASPSEDSSVVASSGGSSAVIPPSSVFGSTPASVSMFGGSTSIFGAAVGSSVSSFGTSAADTTTVSSTTAAPVSAANSSVFGVPTASSTDSVFGTSTPASVSSSVFGSSAATSTSSSVFGSAAPASSSKTVFGGSASVTSSSAFGASAPVSSSSAFGASAAVSSSSVFGASTPVSSSSVFGASTPVSSSSVFGTPIPVSSSNTVFGAPTPALSSSVFGTSTPASSSSSIFGASTPASASSSVFGVSTPASSSGSVFGASTPSSSSISVFGASTSETKSSSVFGASAPSSSTSVFGASTQASSSSVFGASIPASSASVFGGSTAAPSVGSVFGAAAPATSTSVFGGAPTTSSSVFGGSGSSLGSGSVFGGGNSGGFLGGLGGAASSSENASKNPFGGGGAALGSSSGSSIFGGGSSSTNSIFGGGVKTTSEGSFSGGSNIASTGFGVGVQATPAKPPSGFGAGPAFGSPPALGSQSAFGGGASFGSPPAFGASSTFGGGSTFGSMGGGSAPTFGSASSANSGATFGSVSGGSTPGFGSMSGGSTGFGAVTGSTPAFGSGGAPASQPAGKQFNSWR